MFTGIVEDLGEVEAVEHAGDSARVFIRSVKVTHGTRPGDSIAVNGVCLTVTGLLSGLPAAEGTPPDAPGTARGFTADVMGGDPRQVRSQGRRPRHQGQPRAAGPP